jgi:hypothetical protein
MMMMMMSAMMMIYDDDNDDDGDGDDDDDDIGDDGGDDDGDDGGDDDGDDDDDDDDIVSGVTAASTIKRATIIMCINNASVNQWKEQLITWTNLQPSLIKLFTSSFKDDLPNPSEACVVITTYSMVCHGGKRSSRGEMMIQAVGSREWGLMILDEVSV